MQSPLFELVARCRICDNSPIEVVLDLGAQPPANSLRRDRSEILAAIPLVLCRCPSCATLQLSATVSRDYLFRDYVWVTGTSRGAREYSRVFCEHLVRRCRTGPLSVLEVASNDGTFLKRFLDRGDSVLGIDPAKNVAAIAEQSGIPTVAEFFGLELAGRLVSDRGEMDVVFARNVLPHVADARDVVAGIARCLRADGIGAIEFHRADVILEELHYDSIYHEHLFYHSLDSLAKLLNRFGLTIFDVTESPISGGSLVAYFSKSARPSSRSLDANRARERALGIADAETWRRFAQRCGEHRSELKSRVEDAVARGGRLVGYGASARSSTLLNYCGIDCRHIDCVADRSPLKQSRFTPGTDIPIVAPEFAFALRPRTLLLMAWNFRDEILEQIRAERDWHGEVIVPLPGQPTTMSI